MMSIPTVGSKQKLRFFKLKEIEPRKFEARLVGFIKDPAVMEEVSEKVKGIVAAASGEFVEENRDTKLYVFRVPEDNDQAFMDAAMSEGCIFRF